jgi:hypothetical protein
MSDGILYVACGARYLEAAAKSACSVRAAAGQHLRIAVATDGPPAPGFDDTIHLDETDSFRAKILGMNASPFERTLALDVDTYAVGDVSEILHVLDKFDLAAAHAPNRVAQPMDDIPDAFPELNTGVVAFRRNDPVRRLMRAWLDEYDRLAATNPQSKDQPSFRRAVYAATDVRLAVLPPEFNLRFWMAGFQNQPVRILHGWGDTDTYRQVAALLNGRVTDWRHSSVFINRALVDKSAKVIARFPKKPRTPR